MKAFPSEKAWPENPGMDLRDYFAAVALQGQLASNNGWGGNPVERISKQSYQLADAMMKARLCDTDELAIWNDWRP